MAPHYRSFNIEKRLPDDDVHGQRVSRKRLNKLLRFDIPNPNLRISTNPHELLLNQHTSDANSDGKLLLQQLSLQIEDQSSTIEHAHPHYFSSSHYTSRCGSQKDLFDGQNFFDTPNLDDIVFATSPNSFANFLNARDLTQMNSPFFFKLSRLGEVR